MRLTSIRRRRRRRWRQRPEIFRRRWSVATPVGLHPSYVATDHRRFLTTNPGGTPLIIRGKLFRQPRPALCDLAPIALAEGNLPQKQGEDRSAEQERRRDREDIVKRDCEPGSRSLANGFRHGLDR